MSTMTPKEMAKQIGEGLLSFPVTPFNADYSFNETQYRSNMDWLCGYNVAGLFAAGGTGEFFSLSPAEVEKVVGVAVNETRGRVPVLAGAGYGTAIAKDMAIAAERAGADGILLLPPYLTHSEQDGLAAHIEAVCGATKLGVIVYNRDNAIVNENTLAKLCDKCPNLVGYKDGIGGWQRPMPRLSLEGSAGAAAPNAAHRRHGDDPDRLRLQRRLRHGAEPDAGEDHGILPHHLQ